MWPVSVIYGLLVTVLYVHDMYLELAPLGLAVEVW